MPLAWRIFLGTSLVVAVVLGGALAWTARSADRAAAVGAARGVAALDEAVAAYLAADARGLADGAAVFAHAPGFRSVVASGAPADALDQSREAADQLGAAWVQLVDAQGTRLAKSDAPDAPRESAADSPLIRDALAGRSAIGFGTIGDTALAHVAAIPIEGATSGLVVGALMVARPLDPRLARGGAGTSGGEVAFYLLPREAPPRVVASTFAGAAQLARTLRSLPVVQGQAPNEPAPEIEVGGTRYVARAHPLRAATGRVLGGYVALRARDVEYAAFEALRRAILVAGAVGLLGALAVSLAIARQITRPLARLAEMARRAADGDYGAQFGTTSARRDEIGMLAASFETLLDDLHAKQVLVEFARLTRGQVPSGRARGRLTPPRPEPSLATAHPTVRLEGAASAVPSDGAPAADGALGGPTSDPPALGGVPTAEGPARIDPGTSSPAARTPAGRTPAGRTPVGAAPLGVTAIDAAEALRPGQVFADRYMIEAMIGAGGGGVVFRAHDARRGGPPIALKVLRPDVAQHDPRAIARLAREVDTARQLTHPNVVRTFELDEAEGIHFLTMEYVEGRSLRELIDERGPLPVPVAVSAVRQLCRALSHAHARGVVHRDVKPHNACVTGDGVLKVMDFGAALSTDAAHGLTETGTLIGTPAYMAPEVLRGAPHDARADVYAAGVVLYECLTGRAPFESVGSPLAVVTHVLETTPEDPCTLRSGLPRALCDLVLGALAKDPAARPTSADDFERQLAAFT